MIPILVQRLLVAQPLVIYGDGEQTREFVNVRDVAAANVLAATRPEAWGVYNIGSGATCTVNQLAHLIQQASGIRATSVEYSLRIKGGAGTSELTSARLNANCVSGPQSPSPKVSRTTPSGSFQSTKRKTRPRRLRNTISPGARKRKGSR